MHVKTNISLQIQLCARLIVPQGQRGQRPRWALIEKDAEANAEDHDLEGASSQ